MSLRRIASACAPGCRYACGQAARSGYLVALALGVLPPVAAAQGLFQCRETDFDDGRPAHALASPYHLLAVFGDASVRRSNFFRDEYDGAVTATEARLFFPRLSETVDTPVPLPDPYLVAQLKGLKDLDWEDRLDWGLGLEWRPFKRLSNPGVPGAGWLYHFRLYALYLSGEYLRDGEVFAGRPQSDTRVGAELYRECNLYAGRNPGESILWTEIWGDVSWRRTNFVVGDFRSWTVALVPRVGVHMLPGSQLSPMPYVTGELVATERSEPWQNRIVLGVGLRFMPFRFHDGQLGTLLRGTRVFGEGLWVVDHLGGAVDTESPMSDFRIGVGWVINRW